MENERKWKIESDVHTDLNVDDIGNGVSATLCKKKRKDKKKQKTKTKKKNKCELCT